MVQGCGCGPAGGRTGMDCEVFKETCLPDITGDSGCDVRLSSNDVLTVPISSQSGQILQCSPDGLYVPADSGETTVCEPALSDPFWVSTNGGGGKLLPYGSPAGIDYATSHRLDAVINFMWYTPDRVAIWTVRDIGSTSPVYFWGDRMTPNLPLPNQQGSYGRLDSDSYTGTISDAGANATPVPNNDFLTPVNPDLNGEDDPDGGWFGWNSAPYRPLTLESALRRIDCRALVFLRMRSTGNQGHLLTDQVPWLIEDLQRWGRARAAVPLLTPSTYDRAGDFLDAGISPGISLWTDQDVTPQNLIDAGIEYVMLDAAVQDADRRQQFYDASGLTVMTHIEHSRHFESQRELEAGAAGIISDDAVYSRGYDGEDSTTYYETSVLYDGARNKQTGTHSERGPFADGYTTVNISRRYLYIPSPTNDDDTTADRREYLSGALAISDPTHYDITFVCRTNDNHRVSSGDMRIGIAIGSTSDVGAWPQFAGEDIDQVNNYRLESVTGTGSSESDLVITKVTAGEESEISTVAGFFTDTSFPTSRWSVQVRPSTVTVISYDSDWSVHDTHEFEDPDFRGRYVFMTGRTSSSSDAPVEHSFGNLVVGMPDTAFNAPGVGEFADESMVIDSGELNNLGDEDD